MENLILNFIKQSLDELQSHTWRIQRAAYREYCLIETLVRENIHLMTENERIEISETLGCLEYKQILIDV